MKKRWNMKRRRHEPSDPKVDAFIAEILAVCEKHGMSIGHEDTQGAFIVMDYWGSNVEWLQDAHDGRGDS